jgi:homoserine O-succinyltransferase
MPIKIPSTLPAASILQSENVFIIDDERALHQDIRTLRVAILNLMPTKIATETQLLRLLGNTPLQVEVTLLRTASHEAKNTDAEHLLTHYQTFDEIREQHFDGLIITGAPVELMKFEEVDYWQELTRILDWADTNVQSTLHLCWGAQAGLYHRYGIPKYTLPRKMFGIFEHYSLHSAHPVLRGFDETFFAPHSRHTEIRLADLMRVNDIQILARSEAAGINIVSSRDNRHIYVTGHPEYDPLTLFSEYSRDLARGLDIHMPENYFLNNDPRQPVHVRWRSHANLLFANWLNYCVYQASS